VDSYGESREKVAGCGLSTNGSGWGSCQRSNLNKRELLERLDRRSRQRYGIPFSEAFLNDLIKDELIDRSQRLSNKGRRPVHAWGKDAYRRGLQIVRLKSRGVVSRNSQRVLLFLAGYSYPVDSVRKPLHAEYISFGKEILSTLRSRHISHKQAIPAGQKARLIRRIGPLDPAFEKAGMKLQDDILVSLVRSATQETLNEHTALHRETLGSSDLQSFATAMSKLFGGMLLLLEDPQHVDQELDSIESLILNATETVYTSAWKAFRSLDFSDPSLAAILFPNTSEALVKEATEKARLAVRYDPRFASTTFVFLLRCKMWEIQRRNSP
jgi:hypothetical protein